MYYRMDFLSITNGKCVFIADDADEINLAERFFY